MEEPLSDRKRAEAEYPARAGARGWLEVKPFRAEPRETARLLADFGQVAVLLDLRAGMRLAELGCGPGWMSLLAARQGVEAVGFDIAPAMIEIARGRARSDGLDVRFEVADMESLDLGGAFDACLLYDALHHSPRADLVLASARRALRPGGRLLLVEPNWAHRFAGRSAHEAYGVSEIGYTPSRLRRLLRAAGFREIRRFHPRGKQPVGNRPLEVAKHLAEPFVYRLLAPVWTQIWMRATAR